jgi:hypothetical protein
MKKFDKDNTKKAEEKEFYPLIHQPKQKKVEDEEKPEIMVMICRGSVCVQVDMDPSTAQKWCDAANTLLDSDDPKERAKAEAAWDLLTQGKQAEAMSLLGVGENAIANRSNHYKKIPTQPMPDKASNSEQEASQEASTDESLDSPPSPFSRKPY